MGGWIEGQAGIRGRAQRTPFYKLVEVVAVQLVRKRRRRHRILSRYLCILLKKAILLLIYLVNIFSRASTPWGTGHGLGTFSSTPVFTTSAWCCCPQTGFETGTTSRRSCGS